MTVKEIVAEYLKENGYGGLQYDDCGCYDDDLMPCEFSGEKCEPAYKVPVHCDNCEVECYSRGVKALKWCLTTEKPATAKDVNKKDFVNIAAAKGEGECIKCGGITALLRKCKNCGQHYAV